MNEIEIRKVLSVARRTLQSRSKFALFAVDLSHDLYDPQNVEEEIVDDLVLEHQLFWKEFHTQRVIVE